MMKTKYPLWIALAIYWLLTFALLGASLVKLDGHFGYPLDDTYIHMAIAKHFASNGFWGISQSGFSSSTSSPLWTLLIALIYKFLGTNDWTPFILCLLLGNFIICVCYYFLQEISSLLQRAVFLVFIILFTPLPMLTVLGMEHPLHILFTLCLIYCAAAYLSKNESNPRQLALLLLFAGLVTVSRYEGLFLVFSIALLFLIKKQFLTACLTCIAGLSTVTVYGIVSVMQGWYFLPNSVLLKGNVLVFTLQGIAGFFQHLPSGLVGAPDVLALMIACLGLYLWYERQGIDAKRQKYLIILFILISLMHMQFSDIGQFFRYDAYLVLIGSMVLISASAVLMKGVDIKANTVSSYFAVIIIGFLFVTPLAWRAGETFQKYPIAVENIYEQQYQMGLFLKKYYTGKSIAAHDIGAINYLADIKTLDLFGLGSMDVAQARRDNSLTTDVLDKMISLHNVEIVIIYNSWVLGDVPAEWVEVGRWKISNNVVCADDTVSFYAPRASKVEEIIANLRGFSNLLPSTVKQSGMYTVP